MKNLFFVAFLGQLVFAQAGYQGPWSYSGPGQYGLAGLAPIFFAALPLNWVDDTQCNPPNGVYDTTVILGTTLNIGPNDAGGPVGSPYALTPAGLEDAMNNWRDNADDASQTPHFADSWWLIEVPAESTGTVLQGSNFDTNDALISLPGKVNSGTEPTKCLVIDSTTPLVAYNVSGVVTSGAFTAGERVQQATSGAAATLQNTTSLGSFTDLQLGPMNGYPSQSNMYTWVGQTSGAIFTPTSTPSPYMACGGGLPGLGGTRNPGCSSPNDKNSMWEVEIAGGLILVGRIGIYAGADLVTPTNWVNHVVLRDVEVTLTPGIAQSGQGANAVRLIDFNGNPLSIIPCYECQAVDHVGLDRYYAHGWDVGDPGQPAGACSAWTNTGTVTITQNPSGFSGDTLITWASGSYYGMTFAAGSSVTINSTAYTIIDDGTLAEGLQNGTQNTQFIVSGLVAIAGTYNLIESNPPSKNSSGEFSFVYGAGTPVQGCGDDVEDAIRFHADDGWLMDGYVEKAHFGGSSSNALGYGFDNGPLKVVNNWFEGTTQTAISGGAPVDQSGGPGSDNEIRRNYFGKDLNYRFLTGGSSNSPAPPWGCGPADGVASHNVCPFSYAIKNPFENKLGHRNLVAGNIIENSWADGQQGFCILVNARAASGGAMAGIFNPSTGLPNSYIDNIRFESNWIRNCPEPVQQSNRAGTPSNGGGVSLPVEDLDWINNLFSNIADTNQFNNPGHEWEWTSGANTFPCAMSYTGIVAPYTITAQCLPEQNDISENITKIASVANVVSVSEGLRLDPMLSTSTSGTCITNGNSWTTCPIIISSHSGWNGNFAMTGTTGNWAPDGTGGNNVVYTDNINNPGTATLCDNSGSPKCSALLNAGDVTVASLAYKMTDISVGDGVNATNVGGGDTSCSTYGYAAGITSAAYAVSGTATTGLTVVYQTNTQPTASSANCIISNGAGFPKWTTLQNNTFLSPNVFAIQTSYTGDWLPISNYMFNNVFMDNDSGHVSDVYCNEAPGGYEGTDSFSCWDNNTFEFYQNVLTGRTSTNWSVVNCPGGSCSNAFPVSVNCSGASADPTCLGYAAFMGSDPAMTYPTGACSYDGSNPFNCPLMALPWANNFTFTDISYVGSSFYQTQGVNTTQLNTVMKQTEYVCPVGANCGTHGPYPD